MILRSVCNSCFQPYELLLQTSDVELVKQVADEHGLTAPCPRLCGGRINLAGDASIEALSAVLRDPISITGKQLYQAVKGLGLPDELPKDPILVSSLLLANPVVDLLIEEVEGRVYLHELHLRNGVTIHLASGARGATVLKVTKDAAHGTVNPS